MSFYFLYTLSKIVKKHLIPSKMTYVEIFFFPVYITVAENTLQNKTKTVIVIRHE